MGRRKFGHQENREGYIVETQLPLSGWAPHHIGGSHHNPVQVWRTQRGAENVAKVLAPRYRCRTRVKRIHGTPQKDRFAGTTIFHSQGVGRPIAVEQRPTPEGEVVAEFS